jgi:hypothetical protein
MFQFLYFIDLHFSDWLVGPIAEYRGRLHVNGDICIGGFQGTYIQKLTAANRIMDRNDPRCSYLTESSPLNVEIATGSDFGIRLPLKADADHGCVNCEDTGEDWYQYALNRWNENLLDRAHSVPAMRLPVPDGVAVQSGAEGNGDITNSKNLRSMVFGTSKTWPIP